MKAATMALRKAEDIRKLRRCVVSAGAERTIWNPERLIEAVGGRPDKPRVKWALEFPPLKTDEDAALAAFHESLKQRRIPSQIFWIKSHHPALVQARREVWLDMRAAGITLLMIEWITNSSHGNVVKAMAEFVPTHVRMKVTAGELAESAA